MPNFDPSIHHRRSIRLKGYDYTRVGGYFVTIVTHQRQHIFGEVVKGKMVLNEWGQVAQREWFRTAELRSYVELWDDEFVVMPNHVHGIIWMVNNESAASPLGMIVRAYKSAVTFAINVLENQRGAVLWQRNYYEHIIRDEDDFQIKRGYIIANPSKWGKDDHDDLNALT
jgi:putative transposase